MIHIKWGDELKAIGIGVGTLVVGYLLSMFLANFFTAAAPEIGSTYIGFIGFSILYLATVIAICTYALIKHNKN